MGMSSDAPAGRNAAPRTRPGETNISGLFDILRRNLWKIVLATLASLALALTYLATTAPVYSATASLFVDPRIRKVVSEEVVQGGFGSDLALVESQVSILTSDAVLGRVVDTLKLSEDQEYAPLARMGLMAKLKSIIIPRPLIADPRGQAVNSLAQSVKVKRAQKTYVVDLEVSASSPEKAARVAQAIVDAYLADQTAAKAAEAKRANALIDARLGELRDQVRKAETRVDEFRKSNKILSSEGGVVTEQQLSKLNTELITARGVLAEAKARQDQIASALKAGAAPETLPDAVRSGLIQKLREQYAQVARREAALSSQLQSRHPVLVDVRSQLNEVKAQINAELKRTATVAQSDYQVAANRERDLSNQLETAKSEVTRTTTAQIKLRELDQEVAASRELLKLFLSRAKETQEQVNTSTPDARVITAPSVPTKPSKPVAWLILALGLAGGLGLGLASALVSDQIDQSVRTHSDVEYYSGVSSVTELPALVQSTGIVPRLRSKSGRPDRVEAAQFSDLLTAIADTKSRADSSYRQGVLRLLGKLKSHQRPGRPHTIMLVSPRKGAGNSASALALAYAASLAGERVLLVDATSADPELSMIFATTLKPTNVVVLDNKEHLNQITTRDLRSGLAFLPIALADLRTLKNQQRRRLVAGLNGISQNYDLVFIDAGSVLDDEAALCLMPVADQILMVARSGITSRSSLTETAELLDQARDRVTGVILTMTAV
jgi:polysaccharide biosynthesis transport protein